MELSRDKEGAGDAEKREYKEEESDEEEDSNGCLEGSGEPQRTSTTGGQAHVCPSSEDGNCVCAVCSDGKLGLVGAQGVVLPAAGLGRHKRLPYNVLQRMVTA